MLLTGRVAGISGIFGGCLGFGINDRDWRIAFIAVLQDSFWGRSWPARLGYAMSSPEMPANWIVIVAAGLLVGFGTRLIITYSRGDHADRRSTDLRVGV